jgi:hypothetical protein
VILNRFAGVLLLAFALICGAPVAAKDPRPGLFLRNGEAFIFRIEDGQPADIRPAGKDDLPAEGELKAELVDKLGSTLTLTNQTAEQLNYEAWVAKDEFEKGSRTTVCTLIPTSAGYENWPKSLAGLRLTNFEPAGDSFGCR